MIALGIAALAAHEGRQTWHGEGCCSSTHRLSIKVDGPDRVDALRALLSALHG